MMVLTLEASTSAAKALLFDTEKGVIAVETEPYSPEIDSGGMQDAEQVYQATLRVGRKVAQGKDISAIAVSGIWHSIVACDSAMRPVTRTYAWTFTGASDICKNVRNDKYLTDLLYNRTGCMPNITYQPYTLLYLLENGLNLGDKLFLSQGGYNFYRMTGERIESDSIVSGMGFLNTHSKKYDNYVLDYIGIKEGQLGILVTYKDTFPLREDCANILGVAPGIPVVPPYPDGALNQVGSNAVRPGIMTFSVGTSAAIRLSTDTPLLSKPHSTWCYVGVESWLCGAATAGACNCINWFKDVVLKGKWSFAELEEQLLDTGETPVFLPFLFGERCPGWQDDRLGCLYDLKGNMDVTQLYRSICEGILFNVYQCYEALTNINGNPEQIIVSGGILNSKKWTQIAADILNQEISLAHTTQASALGGAALALYAAGGVKNVSDFSYDSYDMLSPRQNIREMYRKKYERYLYWYNKN